MNYQINLFEDLNKLNFLYVKLDILLNHSLQCKVMKDFHLDKVNGDLVFVKKPGKNSYERLDNEFYQSIKSGNVGF